MQRALTVGNTDVTGAILKGHLAVHVESCI
jgi:hypothetical protein